MKNQFSVFNFIILISILLFSFLLVSEKQGDPVGNFTPPAPPQINIPTIAANEKIYIFGAGKIAKLDSAGITYVHNDYLGSASLETDASRNVVSTNTYYPFGAELTTTGTEKYTFTGKELDETNLQYYGARYYDQDTGRFTQIDPLGPGYAYANNNPLRFVDPDGREETKAEPDTLVLKEIGQGRLVVEPGFIDKYYAIPDTLNIIYSSQEELDEKLEHVIKYTGYDRGLDRVEFSEQVSFDDLSDTEKSMIRGSVDIETAQEALVNSFIPNPTEAMGRANSKMLTSYVFKGIGRIAGPYLGVFWNKFTQTAVKELPVLRGPATVPLLRSLPGKPAVREVKEIIQHGGKTYARIADRVGKRFYELNQHGGAKTLADPKTQETLNALTQGGG